MFSSVQISETSFARIKAHNACRPNYSLFNFEYFNSALFSSGYSFSFTLGFPAEYTTAAEYPTKFLGIPGDILPDSGRKVS